MTRLVMLPVIALFVMAGCGAGGSAGGGGVGGGGGTVAVLNAPLFLQATTISSSAIDLSWVDNSTNETGFRIYRGTDPGNVATLIATLGANATSYPDTGLAVSTTYYYVVVAYNSAGDSAASNVANTMTNSDGGSGGGGGGGVNGYFATDFNDTENPISEGGVWLNGQADGMDWSDVKTSNGNATGTQNRLPDGVNLYDDSVAVLNGTWGPDQTVEAVVYAANRDGSGASGWDGNEFYDCIHEVELILRGNMTAHSVFLYEINFSSRIDDTAYTEIGKWTGARGNFNQGTLSYLSGSQYQVNDGDVVRASIVGNTISVYLNNALIATVLDTVEPITQGNPGIGFYTNAGCTGSAHNDDFGFRSIAVSPGGDGG